MRQRIAIAREELLRRYVDEGKTLVVIAGELGCSAATVSNMLKRYAIPARDGRISRRLIPRALLDQLYSSEGLPIKVIAAHFGVAPGTITNRRKEYGIPSRPRKRYTPS